MFKISNNKSFISFPKYLFFISLVLDFFISQRIIVSFTLSCNTFFDLALPLLCGISINLISVYSVKNHMHKSGLYVWCSPTPANFRTQPRGKKVLQVWKFLTHKLWMEDWSELTHLLQRQWESDSRGSAVDLPQRGNLRQSYFPEATWIFGWAVPSVQ